MASKKITPKKQAPPPPPKNTRMDIVLDPARQKIMEDLCNATGQKAQTKAVFEVADYYLNARQRDKLSIQELRSENSVLKNKLYDQGRAMNNFFDAFDSMRLSLGKADEKTVPVKSNSSGERYWCPDCEEHFTDDKLDANLCPDCGLKLKTPEGDAIIYGTGNWEKYCPDCGTRCYQNLNDDFFCPECDEVKTDFD